MKYTIIFLLLMISQLRSFGQSSPGVFAAKQEIVKTILDSIAGKGLKTPFKLASLGLVIDTRYRPVNLTVGFSGETISYSDLTRDSGFFASLNRIEAYPNFPVIDKSVDNHDRSSVIPSADFFNSDTCKTCTKLFVEIGMPLEGWEAISFFETVWTFRLIQDKKKLLAYSLPQVDVPVFVYQLENGNGQGAMYIFTFDIESKNGNVGVRMGKKRKLD